MSRAKQATPVTNAAPATLPVSGRFFTVAKDSHLLYRAFEITVENGVVVATKCLSRAPDMSVSAVGICSRELWVALRNQDAKDIPVASK